MDEPISISVSVGLDMDLVGLTTYRLEMIAKMICLSKKELFYEINLPDDRLKVKKKKFRYIKI